MTLTDLERQLADLDTASRARDLWDARAEARGAAPTVPAATPDPTAPSVFTRPDVEAARRIVAEHQAAATRRDERALAVGKAAEAMAAAATRLATAEQEAAHYTAWLSAVRRAPGACLADSTAALGDLGPLALTFPVVEERADRYVVATYDGQPWEEASTGERYLAGVHFRVGARRAAGLPALPVFVDEAQSVNGGAGPWPSATGIVYLLTTGGEIAVAEGAP